MKGIAKQVFQNVSLLVTVFKGLNLHADLRHLKYIQKVLIIFKGVSIIGRLMQDIRDL